MTILDSYNAIMLRQRKYTKLLGCDGWAPDYSYCNIILVLILINAVIYFSVNVYSMVLFKDDLVSFIFCLVTLGIGIQSCDKLRAYIFSLATIVELDRILTEFHKGNELLSIKIKEHVTRLLRLCFITITILSVIYTLCAGFIVAFPFLIMKFTDEKNVLMFGFVLPGLDYKSSPGYEINYFFQLIQVYCVLIGITVSDAYYTIFLLHGRMQLDVIVQLLKDLNTFIEQDGSKLEQQSMFHDIIKKHKEHSRYMRLLENNFCNHFFVVIFTSSSQLLLASFVLLLTTWFNGYLMVVQAEVQLLIVCSLGTLFLLKCDEFEREIYNIAWYAMEIKQQKNLLMILQMAQRPIAPTFGGVGVLNLHTFLEVNKSIYSYLMVFVSMV